MADDTVVQPKKTSRRITKWSNRVITKVRSPDPYLMILGCSAVLLFWYFAVEIWKLPRFEKLPGLIEVLTEWVSKDPIYGLSIYTSEYYSHIWSSVRRVLIAFVIATITGVALGLMIGWSRRFKEYVFPVFEILRPIPALAWVPLAILMFTGTESAVIYITFLPSFFATTLNTILGVRSIDESYIRAAQSLGASSKQTFFDIIVPGSMPYIFTGLQISVGVAWFSLVAGEMVAGEFGLGYVIYTGYTLATYPTIIIGMITLGIVGYLSSVIVRLVGDWLMAWRAKAYG